MGAECISCSWTPFVGARALTASAWAARVAKKKTKRNLLNVGMGGWMKALADKEQKREQIPQHCYISHNHPYLALSDTLGGTISIYTATYVGICGCVQCSIVVEFALLVSVLCQPVPSSIQPSLHFGRFLLEIFLNFLYVT